MADSRSNVRDRIVGVLGPVFAIAAIVTFWWRLGAHTGAELSLALGGLAGVLALAYTHHRLGPRPASGGRPDRHWTPAAAPEPRDDLPADGAVAECPDVDLVRVLASIIDSEDPFTSGRSYRISRYALRVGEELGMPASDLADLELAALLHDVGKTAIQHEIFHKAGSLDEDEHALMTTHSQTGFYILKDIPALARAAQLVRFHHEQPDGEGYPQGLTGEAIPLGSRIIMVAAAFDAMTSDRPYRPGFGPSKACEELRRHAGTMFDRTVVETFIALYQTGRLFDRIDRTELELHSNHHGKSLAIEEYLAKSDPSPGYAPVTPVRGGRDCPEIDFEKGDEHDRNEVA